MDKEQAGIWLAAMIEGEGHVSRLRSASGKHVGRAVAISNTDIFILQRIAEALETLGVEFNCYGVKYFTAAGKPNARIHVSHKRNFWILWEWCGPWMVSHKRERLRHLAFGTRSPSDARPLSEYDSRRGKAMSDEHRAKISAARMGHEVTPETRAKISAAQTRTWAAKRSGTNGE